MAYATRCPPDIAPSGSGTGIYLPDAGLDVCAQVPDYPGSSGLAPDQEFLARAYALLLGLEAEGTAAGDAGGSDDKPLEASSSYCVFYNTDSEAQNTFIGLTPPWSNNCPRA